MDATNEAFDFSREVLPGGPLYCVHAGGVTPPSGAGDVGKERRKERDIELEVVGGGGGGGGTKKADDKRGHHGDKR